MKNEGIHHKGTEHTKADTKNINVRRKRIGLNRFAVETFEVITNVPVGAP
jgi:hypothetical protein